MLVRLATETAGIGNIEVIIVITLLMTTDFVLHQPVLSAEP